MKRTYPLHNFKNKRLAETALTHKSSGTPNNERLEWLGDSLLDFLISQLLYEQHPNADEGKLSHARAHLVSGPMLAEICRSIELPPLIKMSANEESEGGRQRDKLLADIFESYLAAIYLDDGAIEDVVSDVFYDQLNAVANMLEDGGEDFKNAKSRLQEFIQQTGCRAPIYRLARQDGKAHAPLFFVECLIDGEVVSTASGSNRRAAEVAAAEKYLALIAAETATPNN